MILNEEVDVVADDDEVKDEADEDENEDALCVLRRCCLELLSALAAVSEAFSYPRQGGGEAEERNSWRSLSSQNQIEHRFEQLQICTVDMYI